MARVRATEFKARCLELMDRVAEQRESYVITKRGKPVARLVPVARERTQPLFGRLRGLVDVVEAGDILAPVVPAAAWATQREWDRLNVPKQAKSGRRRTGAKRR